jgi:hypothetical protein
LRKNTWALTASAAIAIVLFVVGAVGCGSSDDTASGEGESAGSSAVTVSGISKAALLKRGDAICAEGRERVAAAAQSTLEAKPGEREEVEIELISKALVPALKTDVDDLRKLGAPEGDAAQVDAIVSGIEELLELAEAEPQAFVLSQNPEEYRPDPWRKTDKIAEEYGFKECPRS